MAGIKRDKDGNIIETYEAPAAAVNPGTIPDRGNTPTLNGQSLTDAYKAQADQYLKAYQDNQFGYDFNDDPVFQQAREAYIKQGKLAAKNTAAGAAAMTGGYGNSYGTVAAQQVMNQALDQVNGIIPELQQNAYQRYADEQNKNLSLADRYLSMYNDEYNRQWNEDERAYSREQDAYNRAWNEDERAYNRAWNEDERAYNRAWNEDERAYSREQDAYNRQWSEALQRAQVGDYSALSALGVDVSSAEKRAMLELAMSYADAGDYSLLKSLGVDTSYLEYMQKAAMAKAYGSGTGSGGAGAGDGGGSGTGAAGDGGSTEDRFDSADAAFEAFGSANNMASVGTVSSGPYKGAVIFKEITVDQYGRRGIGQRTVYVRFNQSTGLPEVVYDSVDR